MRKKSDDLQSLSITSSIQYLYMYIYQTHLWPGLYKEMVNKLPNVKKETSIRLSIKEEKNICFLLSQSTSTFGKIIKQLLDGNDHG